MRTGHRQECLETASPSTAGSERLGPCLDYGPCVHVRASMRACVYAVHCVHTSSFGLCLHGSTRVPVYTFTCTCFFASTRTPLCVYVWSHEQKLPLFCNLSGPPGPLLGPRVTVDLRTQHLGWGGGGAVRTLLRAGTMEPPNLNPALFCLGGCGLSRVAPKSQSPAGSWDTVRACLPGRGQGSVTSVCQAHLPLSPGWRPQHVCLCSP